MEDNKTSIIILHHFGKLIERCLKSLENVNADKIVISSDVDKYNQSIMNNFVYCWRNESTFKRNWGGEFSKGRYIVFMDDDIEIKYDCIKRMEDYLNKYPKVGMVYAMLYKMDNHNKIDTSGSFLSWCGFLYETYIDRIRPIPILSGKSALCMIRKELFNNIGKFDEDFIIYGEETDLSWRVWLAGYKVMVLPSAIGYHAFETTLKPKSYYNPYYIHYHGCKNYITMLIKNLPANKLYIVLINTFIWFIMGCLMWFKNRQASKWIFEGIWYNIRNFRYIWQKRQKIQKNADHSYWKLIYKNPPLFYYLKRFKDYFYHNLHG